MSLRAETRLARLEGASAPNSTAWEEIVVLEGEDADAAILATFGGRPENLIICRIVSPKRAAHAPAA